MPDPPNLASSNFGHHGVEGGLAGTWDAAGARIRNSGPAKGTAGYEPGLNDYPYLSKCLIQNVEN